jgi:SPP1 family predicted phage head-tail adaptor
MRANPKRASSGLQAGTLNTRVSLQRKASGKDRLGAPVVVWTEYAKVWGAVLQLSGRETLTSDTEVDTAQASIRIRYRTDVSNGDRAITQGTIFNIASRIPNVSTREYTDLICTSNSNAG